MQPGERCVTPLKTAAWETRCGSDSCFVDDVVDKACTVKRAKVLVSAVA